jgi:hypothetical protein
MTERFQEQLPNSQPFWPLSPEEVALAKRERDEIRINEELARQRRAEGLAEMERLLGVNGDTRGAVMPASVYSRPLQADQPTTAPLEAEPEISRGRLMVDGKPVHMSSKVSDAQLKAYIASKQQAGATVKFEQIDRAEVAFTGGAAGDAAHKLPHEESLGERIGLTEAEGSFPLQRKRLDFVKNRKLMGVGATAIVALSLAGGAAFLAKPGEDNGGVTASVGGPDVINASTEKEIDMRALISDCAPDKIGAPLANGTMSIDAGVIWNIPGTTEQFPKVSLGAWDHDNNPGTEPVNEPRFLPVTANNITVSMAVCDPADVPAVLLKDGALHVNLSDVSPQIAFEAGAENAPELSALRQEDLNKLVADKWMSQEAANTLRTNMINPNMAIAATKEVLHGVVEQMKQKDNKTGLAVVAAIKAQLQPAIAKQLPPKSDGKPYEVILDGEFVNTRLSGVGVDAAKSEAFTIDNPRIVAEKITPPASEKK